jgi:hypothetical protein
MIRDPVHGDVIFTEQEKTILDTAEIQRLRGIKQLGTAYLVYPGALHTRFDHSVGTMAVAKRIISTLRSKGHEISDEEEMIITASALAHDVSHVPFGHTFEDERKILPGHERTERLNEHLADSELSDSLAQLGILEETRCILEAKEPLEKNHPEPWMPQIVKDAVSSDLLDYLRRDAYFTGLAQDYDDRLFHYFIIASLENQPRSPRVLAVDLGKQGMVRQDARSEVMHLLRMRYFLTERVYYHHAKQASGAMISKALEICINHGFDPADLARLNDWTLLEVLKGYDLSTPIIRKLIEGVEARKLYKRAFVLGPEVGASRRNELISLYNRPGPEREELESMIVSKLGKDWSEAGPGDIIAHCPDLGTMKEARVFARDEEGLVERLHRHRRSISRDLDVIENQYAGIWRFFVFSKPRPARTVGQVCKEFFQEEGGYLAKSYD